MTAFVHATVLGPEVVELLAPSRPGVRICDGTVGGGGHSELLLDAASPDATLLGLDRDPSALEAAGARLARFGDRVRLQHARYSELPELGEAPFDAILLDLGVSSPQLDHAERGFSFRNDGPLDMRMDPTSGEPATELIDRVSEPELVRILREYGEERFAGRIARRMKEERAAGRLSTTAELQRTISGAVPTRERHKDPATRTFQALRIAVNDELGELERFLDAMLTLLAPGGRVAIISFHSLEDGLVKHRFRALAKESGLPDDIAAQLQIAPPPLRLLTKKAVRASDEELARNPRARSACLRAAERISA